MNRISTLAILILASIPAFSQNTYVNNGTSADYSLGNGDSLYIQSGTYTGDIWSFHQNATITVAAGATFRPSNFNNAKGKLTVMGGARLSSFSTNKKFRLHNYGSVEFTGNVSMNGGDQDWNNYFGATIKFSGTVAMNSGATLVNEGTVTASSSFTLNSGSELTNKNIFSTSGVFTNNGAKLDNTGKLETGGLTFNSGNNFHNNCRLVVNGPITNHGTLVNDGLIWIPAQYNSTITNTGTITNTANGYIKSRDFTNYGTLNGKGHYYFTGATYNSGTVGVSGTTTDSIRIFDASRSNQSTIFDVQWGTVRANAKFVSFPAPDTTYPYASCGIQYLSMMSVLPVKWNFFFVNISNNSPLLTWSSEQENGTVFQVERSFDGSHFTAITHIASVAGKSEYQFEDRAVGTQNSVVYYRVKATEPTGNIEFSDTRLVRLSNKPGIAIQTAPNPFTSQFSINYQSETIGSLVIRIYSMNGQLQASKSTTVSKGFNSVAVTEAASLARGFYMVQLTMNNNLVGTEKIVKQ